MRSSFRILAILLLTGLVHCTPPPSEPPNIVIIMADDQAWFDIGPYGSPDVHTPNLDRLASEGLMFNQAFTSTAMCSPTRQMLFTGLYPVRSGAYPNHSVVNEGTQSIVHYLDALGYRSALSGKQHIGPPSSFPFEVLNGDATQSSGGLRFGEVEAFITRDDDQPFFLMLASTSPHYPWTVGPQDRYDPNAISLPPTFVDTPETRAARANYMAEITAFDEEVGQLLEMLERTGQADNTLVIYSSEQGYAFPFGKWTLYDAGIRLAMIMRWPGHIQAGTETDAMVHHIDVVPTLVEAAGGPAPTVDGTSFLQVLTGDSDQHRTHTYGIHTTRGINGWAFDYPIRAVRSHEYKLILNLNAEELFSNTIVALNRGAYYDTWLEKGLSGDEEALERYRLLQKRPPIELYHVASDPHEMKNLVGDPAHADVQSELMELLLAWMEEQGDRGMETEQDAHLHMRNNPDLEKRRVTPSYAGIN